MATTLPVEIHLLCHNEATLLPHTLAHYRRYIPGARIIVHDNESTDGSPELAAELGAEVRPFTSEGIMNEFLLTNMRNQVWQRPNPPTTWIIMADADEWLCVSAEDLAAETHQGTTLLDIAGYNVVGQSQAADLSDIDLQDLRFGVPWPQECKNICFRIPDVVAMNYTYGAHQCQPEGYVVKSTRTYTLRHMCWMGLPYIQKKTRRRYERAKLLIDQYGINAHYSQTDKQVRDEYMRALDTAVELGSDIAF